mgnify:CR=1 FL=1
MLLTYGKIYNLGIYYVKDVIQGYIINDNNEREFLHNVFKQFITIEEWRETQLNKIL